MEATDAVDPSLFELVRSGMGDAIPFAGHVGVRLAEVADGASVAVLPDAPSSLNHVGTVHAGALFTLAETASGAAMAGALAPFILEVRPVVTDASIDYRRPARGELVARGLVDGAPADLRAQLEADGAVRFGVAVTIVDAREREVAEFRASWYVKRQSRTGDS
jgi:uncharacterized protein (TIGR00369 family)